jgi:hypothetical protein
MPDCSVCEVELKDYCWHFETSKYRVISLKPKQLESYHGQILCQECNDVVLDALYARYPKGDTNETNL